MNIDIKRVKIFVTIPLDSVEKVREAVCNAGAGIIGEYTFCTSSTKSIGTFIPSENANPHIGERNKLEFVEEEKLEFVCDVEKVKEVIEELRKSHPYEEPAIDIILHIRDLFISQRNNVNIKYFFIGINLFTAYFFDKVAG